MKFELPSRLGPEMLRTAGMYVVSVCAAALVLSVANAAVPPRDEPMTRAATPAEPAPAPRLRAEADQAIAFLLPIKGEEVNSPFGLRRLPWEAHGRLHAGVDIAAPDGTPVHATAPGRVVRAGKEAGYGHVVDIAHAGGIISRYAHMGSETPGLELGAYVAADQVIGFVGSTGRSTGAHLHFELRRNGRPLNPQQLLDRTFASLDDLPLRQAARIPSRVRVAVVSRWPESVLKAKADAEAARAEGRVAGEPVIRTARLDVGRRNGRVRATLRGAVPASAVPSTPVAAPFTTPPAIPAAPLINVAPPAEALTG